MHLFYLYYLIIHIGICAFICKHHMRFLDTLCFPHFSFDLFTIHIISTFNLITIHLFSHDSLFTCNFYTIHLYSDVIFHTIYFLFFQIVMWIVNVIFPYDSLIFTSDFCTFIYFHMWFFMVHLFSCDFTFFYFKMWF